MSAGPKEAVVLTDYSAPETEMKLAKESVMVMGQETALAAKGYSA